MALSPAPALCAASERDEGAITVGSVCSGIGAPEHAWLDLGWRFLWQSEIEPFPSAVLAARFPGVPNLGDMTTIADRVLAGEVVAPDVLVGGTPCTSFSVAGLRRGLDCPTGNLALEFIRLADAIDAVRLARGQRPCAVVWENVPGVLSDKGNAFGCFLSGLCGEQAPLVPGRAGWTDAGVVDGPVRRVGWRLLDARFFGLAQRRRRVFVVASSGGGADPCEVLFESAGVLGNHPSRREAGPGVAVGTLAGTSPGGGWRVGTDEAAAGHLIPAQEVYRLYTANDDVLEAAAQVDVAATMNASCGRIGNTGTHVALAFGGNDTRGPIQVSTALNAHGGPHGRLDFESETFIAQAGIAPSVRRLTPTEAARLQGFPDDWCDIPWRGRPASECPDGPRYRAYGNSMAVPCLAFIGRRLERALSPASPLLMAAE